MFRKILSSLVVLSLVIGGGTVLQVMGGSPQGVKSVEQKAKSSKEQKGKLKAQGYNLKAKQVGTPTVQQLLDKVKANYSKIKDLKADQVITVEKPGGWGYPLFTDKITEDGKFYFKAPDKLKYEEPDDHDRDTVFKGYPIQRKYVRYYHGSKVPSTDEPWYALLDPDNLPFYWRLDEIITKFDTKVISNPQPNIWVIEAVPKASNPDDEYNYPLKDAKYQIFVNYNKGVITNIDIYGITLGRLSGQSKIENFQLFGDVWIPTRFVSIGRVTEEITLNNIQLNTGIPDREFEF